MAGLIGADVLGELRRLLGPDHVLDDEPLARHTSFRLGGPADAIVLPQDLDQLRRVLELARRLDIPIFVLGNGTNLIVRDKGIRGLVVKTTGGFQDLRFRGPAVWAGAGLSLAELSSACADRSLTGLEFAEGIPGTVGGAVVMNAGAYDGEMAQLVSGVQFVGYDGTVELYDGQAMRFGYRSSALQDRPVIVTGAQFTLKGGDHEDIRARMIDLSERRRQRQPLHLPSAGSVFRRPPGHFAGKLIQDAGMQGARVGGATVSLKHAGFIVNDGGATASDVLALIHLVQEKVKESFGVELQVEVKVVGEE